MHKFALIALAAAAPALGHEHIHLTVDTAGGQPGDAIVIRAGYYGDEAHVTIDGNGRILHDGEVAVFPLEATLEQEDAFHDWRAGNPVNLTSDFYFATGRLDGGDFYYEITSVTVVDAHHEADAAWGHVHVGVFEAEGVASADSRLGRSFHSGIGGHPHDQATAVSERGVYDITLVAWDVNGKFKDSTPVTFRVDSNACAADFDHNGVLDLFDFLAFQNAFVAQDHEADLDGNGVFDLFDFLAFQNLFVAGC